MVLDIIVSSIVLDIIGISIVLDIVVISIVLNIIVISLLLLAEYKSIDSECQLFREIKYLEFGSRIERSVYNKRKRK